jgi:hypothetical protein
LKRKGLAKRFVGPPDPVESPSLYQGTLAAPLLDRSGKEVGEVRLFIYVPRFEDVTEGDVEVLWRRSAYGFWFIGNASWSDVLSEPYALSYSDLNSVFKLVEHTANGGVRLRSMIRGWKKRKRHKVRDEAAVRGLKVV